MASRRGRTRSTGWRTGLRSQKQETVREDAGEDGAWATEDENEGGAAAPALQTAPGGSSTGEELLAVMRTFLEGQQRREEGFLAELRGLRASLPAPQLGQPVAEQRPIAPSPGVGNPQLRSRIWLFHLSDAAPCGF